jgi:hypothetical protein
MIQIELVIVEEVACVHGSLRILEFGEGYHAEEQC